MEKTPPDAVQVALVALPPMLPASVMVPPAQVVWATPAFAVAFWFMVMAAVLLRLMALAQEPDARLVMVTVVRPLFSKAEVVKLPVPAAAIVIVAVLPIAALGALRL